MSEEPNGQPFSYAVLVRTPQPDACFEGDFRVIYANGELASAKAKAEEWAMLNPGQQAVVVMYVDHVQQVSVAKWMKP